MEPAATPICAHLTWTRCRYGEEPNLCRLVGVDDVTFDERAGWSHEARIVGVRKVDRDRFAKFLDGEGLRVSAEMIGTYEVMEEPDICSGRPCAVKASTFFWRQVGERWVLASWTSNDLSCEGWQLL